MRFRYLAMVCILAGLAIGAGLHIALDQVVVCKPVVSQDPAMMNSRMECRGLSPGEMNTAAAVMLALGAVGGTVFHFGPVRGFINRNAVRLDRRIARLARESERPHHERDIAVYFAREG